MDYYDIIGIRVFSIIILIGLIVFIIYQFFIRNHLEKKIKSLQPSKESIDIDNDIKNFLDLMKGPFINYNGQKMAVLYYIFNDDYDLKANVFECEWFGSDGKCYQKIITRFHLPFLTRCD